MSLGGGFLVYITFNAPGVLDSIEYKGNLIALYRWGKLRRVNLIYFTYLMQYH